MDSLSPLSPKPDSPDPISSRLEDVASSKNIDRKDPAQSSPAHLPMDELSISPSAHELTTYLRNLAQVPDIRQARIKELLKALESNTYVVSSENLAKKILQDISSPSLGIRPPSDS